MHAYADFTTKIGLLLLDKSYMTAAADQEAALATAIDTLAQYRLDIEVVDYVSTGAWLYDMPDDWDNDTGKYDIEYPVCDTADEVQWLDVEMSEIYRVPITEEIPTGIQLRFRDKGDTSTGVYLPPSGDHFRLHYGIPYVCIQGNPDADPPTPDVVTVPDSLFETVCKLGARELCLILSSRLGQNTNQLTGGGTVDFQKPTDTFQQLAKTFFADAMRKLNPAKGERPGYVVFGQFIENPLHRYARTLYPRDNSLRAYTDR